MMCKITKKKTSKVFRGMPISNDVMYFGKWYRDKLNIQQRQKMNILLSEGAKLVDCNKNFVDLRSCINTFIAMKNKSYSWQKTKETLVDEIMLKGLLNDEEYNEKLNEISKTEK